MKAKLRTEISKTEVVEVGVDDFRTVDGEKVVLDRDRNGRLRAYFPKDGEIVEWGTNFEFVQAD